MINSFAVHTTGYITVPASSIATGKIQVEPGGNFVVTRILGIDNNPWISFKITGEPGSNLISDDFISLDPFSSNNSFVNPLLGAGYSRKNNHPIFIIPAGNTLHVTFKNVYSSDIETCLGMLGFYVNDKGQRINDGNIPVNILNRLL
jgi:hypothetical protein